MADVCFNLDSVSAPVVLHPQQHTLKMFKEDEMHLLITNQFINVNPITILQIRFNVLCACLVVSDTLPSFGL